MLKWFAHPLNIGAKTQLLNAWCKTAKLEV